MGAQALQQLSQRDVDAARKLEQIAWRAPDGWIAPNWLSPEPCAAVLPMPSPIGARRHHPDPVDRVGNVLAAFGIAHGPVGVKTVVARCWRRRAGPV